MVISDDNNRPTDQMVELAFARNGDGGGVAWREKGDDGITRVMWEKGLDVKVMKEFAKTSPVPFIQHFRVETIGGPLPELCHPFPILPDVPLWLDGQTEGSVLFHNGHWTEWRRNLLDTALYAPQGEKVPPGEWSDTRAIAYWTYHHGIHAAKFLGLKLAIFGPGKDDLDFWGEGWTRIHKSGTYHDKGGIWCSNDHFVVHQKGFTQAGGGSGGGRWQETNTTSTETRAPSIHGSAAMSSMGRLPGQRMCREQLCSREDFDQSGYCPAHSMTAYAIAQREQKIKLAKAAREVELEAKIEASLKGAKVKGAGGGAAKPPIPFPEASKLWQERLLTGDTTLISKNQFRKSRRAWIKAWKKEVKQDSQARLPREYLYPDQLGSSRTKHGSESRTAQGSQTQVVVVPEDVDDHIASLLNVPPIVIKGQVH